MGRRKTIVKPIQNTKTQNVTFTKRRAGLIKKAMELSILCECNVTLLVEGKNGERSQYSSRSAAELDGVLREFSRFPSYTNSDYAKLYQSESGGLPEIEASNQAPGPVPIAPAVSSFSASQPPLKRTHEAINDSASVSSRKRARTERQSAPSASQQSPAASQMPGGPFIPVQFPTANGSDPVTMMIPLLALPMIGAYYAQVGSQEQQPRHENAEQYQENNSAEHPEEDHQSPSERDHFFPNSFDIPANMDGEAIDPLDASPGMPNSSTNIRKSDDELRIAIPPRQKGYILSPLHSEHSPPNSAQASLTPSAGQMRGSERKEKEKESPPVRMVALPASFSAQGNTSAQSLFSPSLMTPTTDFSTFNFPAGTFTPNSALLPGTPLSWFLPPIPTSASSSSASNSLNSSAKPSSH